MEFNAFEFRNNCVSCKDPHQEGKLKNTELQHHCHAYRKDLYIITAFVKCVTLTRTCRVSCAIILLCLHSLLVQPYHSCIS